MTAERRIALVFDEIQCGLGRLGTLFAYETTGVVPGHGDARQAARRRAADGRVLVNGAIAAAIKPGDHGTTFGGGPFVARRALRVRAARRPALLAHVRETGQWLGGELRGAWPSARGGARGARRGAHVGRRHARAGGRIVERARDAGLLVLTAGEHTLRCCRRSS
jgi:acetylornithine/N-succinyldiaminopimelate aminotransferase